MLPQPNPEPLTVLVVDDNLTVLTLAQRVLDAMRVRAMTANSALSARRILQECADSVRVLLLELRLPGKASIELATLAAERYPWVRVVFMSSGLSTGEEFAAVAATQGAWLRKPFSIELLRRTVMGAAGHAANLAPPTDHEHRSAGDVDAVDAVDQHSAPAVQLDVTRRVDPGVV